MAGYSLEGWLEGGGTLMDWAAVVFQCILHQESRDNVMCGFRFEGKLSCVVFRSFGMMKKRRNNRESSGGCWHLHSDFL
jgi:hypothetical protein